jgi:pimeloyl-ACP methyl ester carboxylesterase
MNLRANGVEIHYDAPVVTAEGDDVQLAVLKSAAHLSNVEQPEAFNRALTAVLARPFHTA